MGTWLRNPRTTQERRANQDWPVRGRRLPNRLPEAWDDVPRRDADDRSWKRHRRTQYKVKECC
jgi:hypothetical protein